MASLMVRVVRPARLPLATCTTRSMRPPYYRIQGSKSGLQGKHFSTIQSAQIKKYSTDHEWVEVSEDGKTATIGISEYAANALGDVVYVELPTTELEVNKGDAIGAVESVKSASDIMTPVSGIVLEANGVLEEKPSVINKGPEGEGWIAKIEVKDTSEMESLMDLEAYKKFSEE